MPMLEKIDWTDHESSNVKASFYHKPSDTTVIKFHGGGLYSYIGAGQEIYMGLVHAPSVGRYLNQVLKAFPYTRWESEDELIAHLNV
jgi:KTSC domain